MEEKLPLYGSIAFVAFMALLWLIDLVVYLLLRRKPAETKGHKRFNKISPDQLLFKLWNSRETYHLKNAEQREHRIFYDKKFAQGRVSCRATSNGTIYRWNTNLTELKKWLVRICGIFVFGIGLPILVLVPIHVLYLIKTNSDPYLGWKLEKLAHLSHLIWISLLVWFLPGYLKSTRHQIARFLGRWPSMVLDESDFQTSDSTDTESRSLDSLDK